MGVLISLYWRGRSGDWRGVSEAEKTEKAKEKTPSEKLPQCIPGASGASCEPDGQLRLGK